jgi:hypothetical protein
VLGRVANTLYAVDTAHYWVDRAGCGHAVVAAKGVDEGGPLSPGFFAVSIAPALRRLDECLCELDAGAVVMAYLDDTYVHRCRAGFGEPRPGHRFRGA